MTILLGVVLLFAVLSGAAAAAQAVAINRVAPAGEWRGWILGWWRFGEVERRAGTAGAQQFGIYKRAVIACVAFVLLGLILSGWAANQRSMAVAILTNSDFIGQRFDTAGLIDHSYFRSVASMPGAISLES